MPHLPSSAVQAACLLLSAGFLSGVFVASCTPEQRKRARDVVEVVEVICEIAPEVHPDAKEVCVTEEELRKAIRDIVSTRKAAGGVQGKGAVMVRLP